MSSVSWCLSYGVNPSYMHDVEWHYRKRDAQERMLSVIEGGYCAQLDRYERGSDYSTEAKIRHESSYVSVPT